MAAQPTNDLQAEVPGNFELPGPPTSTTGIQSDVTGFAVYPGAVLHTYVNRVIDTLANGYVRWETTGAADPTGLDYPGPGAFGVDTSDYCVESIL